MVRRKARTRAVVMNPVDHPMGGGEGKASGGHLAQKTVFQLKDTEQEIKRNLVTNL